MGARNSSPFPEPSACAVQRTRRLRDKSRPD
jgi:hypothetical protein